MDIMCIYTHISGLKDKIYHLWKLKKSKEWTKIIKARVKKVFLSKSWAYLM